MKRYIFISVMLVFTLGISAQNTNSGRGTRASSPAVKEKKASDEVKKDEIAKEKPTEKRVIPSTTSRGDGTKATSTTRSRTSSSSVERKPAVNGNQGRSMENSSRGGREVRTRTNEGSSSSNPNRDSRVTGNSSNRGNQPTMQENSGVRDRGASSNRSTATNRTWTRSSSSVSDRGYTPRNEQESVTVRRTYTVPERRVVVRNVPNPNYVPRPVEYRRTYYPYHAPARVDIIWNVQLYNEYRYLYPNYNYWYYPVGYRVHTVSAYDADRYIGEFARIYGRVYDAWYSIETNQYYLYFGEAYPYQDFTVIIDARDAERFNRRPERYFKGRNIAVTGIVSVFEGKPEMLIKRRNQIDLYF